MAGSIEKRGDNSWRLVVSGGFDSSGKRIKHTRNITATSKREAEKELAKFVAEIEKGQFVEPSRLTFADFVERWIKDYAQQNPAPKTLARYAEMLKSRIIPAMGHLKLELIKPVHLLEFYNNLKEDGIRADGKSGGLSDKTVLHHHRLISAILQDAVEWQLLISNPATRVKPPKVKKTETAHYDDDQTLTLLSELEKEPFKYKVMIVLTVFTGLRRGELMGLGWRDIDFDKRIIHIRQASQYVSGKGTFLKDPKNDTSKRLIGIPEYIISLLKEYKAWQEQESSQAGELWQESGRLFTQWSGIPMHPDTISKWFPKFIRCHNLPYITLHGLRHTNASLLISQGLDIKTISKRLGHSSTSTTLEIYGHMLKKADMEAADCLEKLLVKKED